VGKTSLIDERRPIVTAGDGWFVAGKFDQYRRDQEFDGLGRLDDADEIYRTIDRLCTEPAERADAVLVRMTWIGLEPDRRLRARLVRRAVAHGREPRVLAARAEAIPLPDASVDAVVATVVLCSVADPSRVMREVRRVVRPGGRFVFVEHVAADPGTASGRLRSAFAPLTRRFDRGCDPTRRTATTIRDAGFSQVDIETYGGTGGLALHSPHIAGVAIR
jgi:SAM-dependent methyltransferase